ncbi:hypothetical protein [Spiroplasma clarkii]|uniref:hypothetical protein n=1 Tax=Spiroplasma clarkii TaxID=2139 RepID=UPI0011BA863C|nr:hypothetical protein [Spiroplasma clarkii]
MTEEVRRIFKTSCKGNIAMNLETAFSNFLELASKDINGNLDKNDLTEGTFYVSGQKNENAIIRLNELEKNQLVEILWFTKTHKFIRRLVFKELGKNKTRIKFIDICKGMSTVFGFMDNYKKRCTNEMLKNHFKYKC